METYLDMGNHFIYNVKTPINIDHGVNKSYTDTKLSLSSGLMTGNLDMNTNRIYNVAQQMAIISQPQKYGQKINSSISPVELWQDH